ncbi:MAG: monoheme cytochrome C [Flavobacteriaceae bacterium]
MSNRDLNEQFKKAKFLANSGLFILSLTSIFFIFLIADPTLSIFQKNPITLEQEIDDDKIENGVHLRTGLIDAEGLRTVINNCTNCHSAKLVTQNRMNEERWNATIKWMQETQNLWELGDKQKVIVDYLVTNYPITDKGRRASLTNIEWYEIED